MVTFGREWMSFAVLKDAALHANAVSASIAAESASEGRQTVPHPMPMQNMQGMLFADPVGGAYLVSPSMVAFANGGEPLRSARPVISGQGNLSVAHPAGFPSSGGLLTATGMAFNIGSALTPTTRALFSHLDQKSPHYLNFASHFPPTPSAALFGNTGQIQRSPGLRGGFPYINQAASQAGVASQASYSFPRFSVNDYSSQPSSPSKAMHSE